MELKIGTHVISKYSEVSVSLRYDSIADTFAFKVYFDPDDAKSKAIFRPGSYQRCTVTHNKQTLITGVILSPAFSDSAVDSLTALSGYSITGRLADCCVYRFLVNSPTAETVNISDNSIEFNNQNLEQIANLILDGTVFGNVVVDSNVQEECSKVFVKQAAQPTQTVEDFLSQLATQRNVVLSHTADGRVLLTKSASIKNPNTVQAAVAIRRLDRSTSTTLSPNYSLMANSIVYFSAKPIYFFTRGQETWTRMEHSFNGQKMHSHIEVIGQKSGANVSDDLILNPYVANGFRFTRKIQTIGDDNDTQLTARDALGTELKAIMLNITIVGWELNGALVRPNQIISVLNPNAYIYKKTNFFIESVDFNDNPRDGQTAVLNCVLPEVYNDEPVKNIYD